MRGISSLIAAVFLVVISLSISVMVSGWVTSLSSERAEKLKNLTEDRINCQYASLYIRNITYVCNNSCFSGSPYKMNATIENTGGVALDIYRIITQLNTGNTYTAFAAGQRIESGSTGIIDFNAILVYNNVTHVTYNVTYDNIYYVTAYNSTNDAIASSGQLAGVSSYENTIANSSTSYKIEVEDTNGYKIAEYYPFAAGETCLASTNLEKVTISSSSCPSTAVDSFYGTDITFVNCTT